MITSRKKPCISNILISIHWNFVPNVPNPICSSRRHTAPFSTNPCCCWRLSDATTSGPSLSLDFHGIWWQVPGSSAEGPEGRERWAPTCLWPPSCQAVFAKPCLFTKLAFSTQVSVFWKLSPFLSFRPRGGTSSAIIKPGYCVTLCGSALLKVPL